MEEKKQSSFSDVSLYLVVGILLITGLFLQWSGKKVHWPGFLAMVFFYGVIYYIGIYASKQSKDEDAESLILAGRNLPLPIAIFTMSATWVGGGYINGTAEATAGSGLVWVQAPWGYALSLIVGGLFFAGKMRRHGFTTMLDPFEDRYGKGLTGVLFLPALLGEIFWTAAILTALGTTFGTVLGLDFTPAIILSALVAIAYTSLGGLYAVAYTDVIQLFILFAGLIIVVPFSLEHIGGMGKAWALYQAKKGHLASFFPPWNGFNDPNWGNLYWNWWDFALLLILGGIPWNVYFQRVLAAKNEGTAVRLSLYASVVCLAAAVPAVLIGIIGDVVDWSVVGATAPESAALTLPFVLRYLTHPVVATLGLGALAAAVMSSVDSSILSASSMAAWNVYRPIFKQDATGTDISRVVKICVWIFGLFATLLALKVKSVYVLWFLCSDLVYTMLFPQLVLVLFDPKSNKMGAACGLLVSFFFRIGGGESILGLPCFLPYPMIDAATGNVLFPFRTFAMVCGLIAIFVVSRFTAKICPPQPLRAPGKV